MLSGFQEVNKFCQRNQIYLVYLLNLTALAFRPSTTRVCLTIPILAFLAVQSLWRKGPLYFGDEITINCWLMSSLFTYMDWIVLASPDKEHWQKLRNSKSYENGHAKGKRKRDIAPVGFVSRFWWAIQLAWSPRYVGWSSQVKNIPAGVTSGYPRWRFILRKLFRLAFMFTIADTLSAYTTSTPHGAFRYEEAGKQVVGLADVSWRHGFVLSWVYIINTYASLEFLNCVASIIYVATGLARPEDCPRMNGDLQHACTVRKSWSIVWHHLMRRNCSALSTHLARHTLKLRPGSFLSKYIQLFTGFLVSALIHAFAAQLSHHSMTPSLSATPLRTGSNGEMTFFMAQAAAILFEDHVILLGRKMGLRERGWWRGLGYVWVALWFGISAQGYVSGALERGIWIHQRGADFWGVGMPKFSG